MGREATDAGVTVRKVEAEGGPRKRCSLTGVQEREDSWL